MEDIWKEVENISIDVRQYDCISVVLSTISKYFQIYFIIDQAIEENCLLDEIIQCIMKSKTKKLCIMFCSSRTIQPEDPKYFIETGKQQGRR